MWVVFQCSKAKGKREASFSVRMSVVSAPPIPPPFAGWGLSYADEMGLSRRKEKATHILFCISIARKLICLFIFEMTSCTCPQAGLELVGSSESCLSLSSARIVGACHCAQLHILIYVKGHVWSRTLGLRVGGTYTAFSFQRRGSDRRWGAHGFEYSSVLCNVKVVDFQPCWDITLNRN